MQTEVPGKENGDIMATEATTDTMAQGTTNPIRPTYRLSMVFALDVSLPVTNRISELVDEARPVLVDALTGTLDLTRPGIPSDDEIAEYEQAIEKAYANDRITIERVRFMHYASVREI